MYALKRPGPQKSTVFINQSLVLFPSNQYEILIGTRASTPGKEAAFPTEISGHASVHFEG